MSSKGARSSRVGCNALARPGIKQAFRTVLGTMAAMDALEGRTLLAATLPDLWIDDPTVPEGDSGLTEFHFPVWLTAASDQDVTVDFRAASNSATVGIDLPVQSGKLVIPAGQTTAEVVIYVYGDTEPERDEMFRCYLENAVGANVVRPRGSGIIANDDKPTLSIGDAQVVEGSTGTTDAVFTVSLNAAISTPVTFSYSTANGTATAGSDYAAASSVAVTIPPLTSSVTISIPVNGDNLFELDETFSVVLSDIGGAIVGKNTGIGTILTDEAPRLSIGDASRVEGNSGTATLAFQVSLSIASSQQVTFQYATTAGTATAGADYQHVSGIVTIPAGQTTATILVPIAGDIAEEVDETFGLTLSHVTGAAITRGSAVGTIMNDDAEGLSIADAATNEGDSGTTDLVFTVSLSGVVAREVTFHYVIAAGTAAAGVDYQPVTGTGTIPAGQTSTTIHVPIVGDDEDEASETLAVELSDVAGALLADGVATGTIVNDDVKGLRVADATMNEGNTGTTEMVFTVSLAGVAAADVTFQYATFQGTARAGVDYHQVAGTATIAAGQTSTVIRVPIIGDWVREADEMFSLAVSGVTGAVAVQGHATGTIVNDDHDAVPPTAQLGRLAAAVPGSRTYRFNVTYRDAGVGLRSATINSQDVLVVGPRLYKAMAKLISATKKADGSIVVTYQAPAPGGSWNSADTGVYTLWLQAGQVGDLAGNMAPKKSLGTLRVGLAAAQRAAMPAAASAPASAPAPARTSWLFGRVAIGSEDLFG